MRSFEEIYAIAAERHGGPEALEAMLDRPKSSAELTAVPDDRWLSQMSRNVFSAGFNWKVVENMWPGFEAAFDGFDPGRCAMLNDDDVARLITDTRIVRHGTKIRSVQENAVFLGQLALEHGSAAAFFAQWPRQDYVGLLDVLKRRGSRLGGATGQYFLRFMGKDGFITARDVVARLIAEAVIDKAPTSKSAMRAVQAAFNTWVGQSNRSLTEISRTLALSTG